MSQPVKLSDALVLDARLAAEVQERSIAGQVEYWQPDERGITRCAAGSGPILIGLAGPNGAGKSTF
jgi:hypothetical protein